MTQFDAALRRGLMDANLAQYERVLQSADSAEPDFSPRYLRERMRLLADPWGWMRRRELTGPRRGRRVNWRLIAIVAALLALSACAYAVATGQFSQWFPRMGVDPKAPEVSEEVLDRTGTVIEQSQTVDGVTVDLNAAVWDGDEVWLSLVLKGVDIPEEVAKGTHLYTEECSLTMPEEKWKEYVIKDEEAHGDSLSKELLEQSIQNRMDEGQVSYWRFHGSLYFYLLSREEDTLTFEGSMSLAAYVERPELTLHLENIATYEDGKGEVTWIGDERTGPGPKDTILKGPMDFTFTLEEPILPIHYAAGVDITLADIPFRFTGFDISLRDLNTEYEVLAPVNEIHVSRPGEPEPEPDPEKLDDHDVTNAAVENLLGLWTADGGYVDLEGMPGGMSLITGPDGEPATGSAGRNLPHPVDPSIVTALNIGGTRVELGGLERRER